MNIKAAESSASGRIFLEREGDRLKYVDYNAVLSLAKNIVSDAKSLASDAEELRGRLSALEGSFHDDGFDKVNEFSKALFARVANTEESLFAVVQQLTNYASLLKEGKGAPSSGTGLYSFSSPRYGGDSAGYSRHFSHEEAKAQYQRAVGYIDETVQIYREELVAHGANDGAMLTKFLAKQRAEMLQYEAEEINAAQGLRAPLTDGERYRYVIVGKNSPYNYDHLLDQFGTFCMSDIQSWVSAINPDPNNDPRRRVNCGKCAAAVFQRLNGSCDAVAGLGTYSISEMDTVTGRVQTPMSPSDIENYLRSQGAGSHVVVGADRASGAGHWFNAFFDGHRVYTIEGQSGEISGWPPDYGNVVYWDASV